MSHALLLAAIAHGGAAAETYGTIEPRRLEVHLDLDPARPTFEGTSLLTFEHSKPVDRIVVHAAEGLELDEAWFVRGTRRWPATLERLEGEQVAILPARPIPVEGLKLARPRRAARGEPLFATPSFVAVELAFHGSVNTQPYGLYRFEVDGQPFLVTQFEADDAREAFPCVDRPDAKVSLWLELTVPEGQVALGNAPVVQTGPGPREGTQRVVFARTRPIPTYAVAFAVGPYRAVPIPEDLGQVWTVPGREEAALPFAAEIPPLLAELEGWFGSPQPFQKLDFLAVPEFAFGGMENPGLVVFTDRLLAPADQLGAHLRRRQQGLIAHELAHLWFGDLVTLAWWDDFWLNESFAELVGNQTAHAATGDPGFAFERVRSTQGALKADGHGTMRPIRTEIDPTRIFETTNFLAYPKGEAVLTMVQHWMGPDRFQQGVRAHLAAHADGNATSADLFEALGQVAGRPVGELLEPWLDRPGAPLIHLEPTDGGWRWRQERYLAAGARAEADGWWPTPLALSWEDDGGVHTRTVLLEGPEGALDLPVEGELAWIFPHAQGVGYYAWALPDPWLEALIRAAPEALEPAERVALVGNLDLLAAAGRLDGGQLLAHLARFSAETHPQVLDELLSAQAFVERVLDEADRPRWAAYVRATRGPWLAQIGLEPTPGEDPELPALRARLMRELLWEGQDEAIRDHFREVGRAFLEDEARFDPIHTPTGLRVVAEEADPGFVDTLLQRAEATDDPRLRRVYLGAIGRVPGGVERATALIVDPAVPARDTRALFAGIPDETDADKDRNLDWLLAHHDEVAAKIPPQQRSVLARIGAGCDEARWTRARAFFSAEERRSPAMDRAIAEGDETLALCQAARALHGPSVAAFLARVEAGPEEAEESGGSPSR